MPRFEDLAAEGQALVEVGGAVVGVDVATQAELDGHATDTTDVHGIADTAALATQTYVDTAVDNATYRRILAETRYDPATIAVYSATATTFADLDATNMAVTFTAVGTEVLVTLEALMHVADGDTAQQWNLRDAAGNIAGSDHRIALAAGDTAVGGSDDQKRVHLEHRVTGLTAGTTYTWKWGFAREAAVGNGICRTLAGGVAGPAIMRVEHAPVG